MNAVLICFFCVIIFVPIFVNGLQCYQCDPCNESFNTTAGTIITTNDTTQSCYKMVTLQMTIKGIMEYCVDSYANNVAVWCCNTGLCNAAQSIVSMNLKMLISTFLFTIGVVKMIQSS